MTLTRLRTWIGTHPVLSVSSATALWLGIVALVSLIVNHLTDLGRMSGNSVTPWTLSSLAVCLVATAGSLASGPGSSMNRNS